MHSNSYVHPSSIILIPRSLSLLLIIIIIITDSKFHVSVARYVLPLERNLNLHSYCAKTPSPCYLPLRWTLDFYFKSLPISNLQSLPPITCFISKPKIPNDLYTASTTMYLQVDIVCFEALSGMTRHVLLPSSRRGAISLKKKTSKYLK